MSAGSGSPPSATQPSSGNQPSSPQGSRQQTSLGGGCWQRFQSPTWPPSMAQLQASMK